MGEKKDMTIEQVKEEKSGLEFLRKNCNSKKAIILFHGYGASMRDLFGLSEMLTTPQTTDWIFPDGPLSVPLGPMMEGRAWFPIDMQELEMAMQKGEYRNFEDKCPPAFLSSLELAKKFLRSIALQYDEIIIGGFSQGAMLCVHLLGEGVEQSKVKGALLYSTTLLAREKLLKDLTQVSPVPFLQSHGKQDPLLDYNVAMNLFELLKLYRFEGEFVGFAGQHEIPQLVINKTQEFLKKYF